MVENIDTRELQLVSFILANEEYAVDIIQVREIIRMVEITSIPNSPSFVEGVVNIRGKVIPIIDIKKRFNLTSEINEDDTRIVIVEIADMTMGIIVDAVSEVLRLPASAVEPAPSMVSAIDEEYIKGVGKLEDRLLILLDLDRLLKKDELHMMRDQDTAASQKTDKNEENAAS